MEQGTQPRKILVVDDEPFVLKVLVRQLTQLGYEEILSYEHAQDALAVLERGDHSVDVVFTDLQMPGMDGVEFLRQLVQRGYDGQVVLISGEDARILKSAEKLAYSRGLRVLGSLSKPATREQLRRHLHGAERPEPASETHTPYPPEELRNAIATGQIVTCYQPQVALATGEIVGVEAMIGWQHPRDGLVPADRLLASEHYYGVLNDLTRTMLPRTLEQAARWQTLGDDFRIGINLSMDDLAALDFPDFIVDAAARAHFPLSRLVLEINVARMTRDRLLSLDVLTRLRLKRISLLIDDFGAGQSSLAHLRDVPFDELKLDGGFVHGASRDPSRDAIVKASLLLARQLNMRTVAQGIDDLEDWTVLRDLSCDVAQGSFVGAPMPGEALAQWALTWAARYAALVR
ncbi:EAL domain-containing response regulator [Trinickia dinghuensis]|uniref:EAL domain-containing protein n=1 Tax=Trinickia dinghuensis TaxID=2291023 RepID=A0A3D8JVE7_9BURK|nr:EAL domain-containing response regulator [Trinickia dinghuensis]RDU96574.1 EAL domain-containing protein [Trinickia dinghuensis]